MTVHQLACKWLLQHPALTAITGTFLNEHEIREAARRAQAEPDARGAARAQPELRQGLACAEAHPCDLKSSTDPSGRVRSGYVPPPVLIA